MVNSSEKNGKKKEEKRKSGNGEDVKKKEKKVYEMPGQKRDPPEEVYITFLQIICEYRTRQNITDCTVFVPHNTMTMSTR